MADVKTICFDIDGVLCSQVEFDYADAQPNMNMIALVNGLYDSGVRIVLHTSRFMGRCNGDVLAVYRLGYEFTRQQLAGWGLRYHELHMGKPRYAYVVDDRSIFYDSSVDKIRQFLLDRIKQG